MNDRITNITKIISFVEGNNHSDCREFPTFDAIRLFSAVFIEASR